MKFIGRSRELRDLEQQYRKKASFVIVYGRRRIGKTELIREFIKGKDALYYLATEGGEAQNMAELAQGLAEFSGESYMSGVEFKDWQSLFEAFARVRTKRTKILVIDEFPYLANANRAFPSIFQKAWDNTLKRSNTMVILCGSYINMMKKLTLTSSSPLYGRSTGQIHLSPLSFDEIREARKGQKFSDAVEEYAVTGGVPKYMEFFANRNTLKKNISEVILNKNGFLYDEPSFLLNSDVKEPLNYYDILRTIAQGDRRISDIGAKLRTPVSHLTQYMDTLRGLYLVEKREPVTENNPEKSRKGLYVIRDVFMRFWFRFVLPNRGKLELGNVRDVEKIISARFIDSHVSFIYEEICRSILPRLCGRGKIPLVPSAIGSYWDKRDEIDVVALDHANRRLFAAECKYFNDRKLVGKDIYRELREKCERANLPNYDICYGLFSKNGFTEEMKTLAAREKNVHLIHGDRLLR